MNNDIDKLIKKLEIERAHLDKKIAALKTVRDLFLGGHPELSTKQRAALRRRTLDKKANAKTIEFMSERKGPTTIGSVQRKFNISRPAANQRLIALAKAGKARRVGKGTYALVKETTP